MIRVNHERRAINWQEKLAGGTCSLAFQAHLQQDARSVSSSSWKLVFGERRREEQLVVQNYIEQRAVDLQATVVVNEHQFPKPVHEEADSRTSRAYHLGQGLLTDFGNHGLWHILLAKMREQ